MQIRLPPDSPLVKTRGFLFASKRPPACTSQQHRFSKKQMLAAQEQARRKQLQANQATLSKSSNAKHEKRIEEERRDEERRDDSLSTVPQAAQDTDIFLFLSKRPTGHGRPGERDLYSRGVCFPLPPRERMPRRASEGASHKGVIPEIFCRGSSTYLSFAVAVIYNVILDLIQDPLRFQQRKR